MKYILSIFLLIVMIANAMDSLIVQWQGECMTEYLEDGTEDGCEKAKIEKEKDTCTFCTLFSFQIECNSIKNAASRIFYTQDRLIFEHYAFLPEIPPEV